MADYANKTWQSNDSRTPRSTVPSKRRADAEEDAWVAEEDNFVLRQAKKKARLRVKGNRGKPIDWLAVTLSAIDNTPDPQDHDDDDSEVEVPDPEGVFEELNEPELQELSKGIDSYLALEKLRSNKDYWGTMKVICDDRLQQFKANAKGGRGVNAVMSDVDKLLQPKSLEDLEKLEKQIRQKLRSNEPIDVDYWEQLLRSLLVWKARARLKKVTKSIVDAHLAAIRQQQADEATVLQMRSQDDPQVPHSLAHVKKDENVASLGPETMSKLRTEDKSLEVQDESTSLKDVNDARKKGLKIGFVSMKSRQIHDSIPKKTESASQPHSAKLGDDSSQTTAALYEREVARGVNENEEIFTNEEVVSTSKPQWANKYRPRKPRYFNRVQMGYEWNKYNQTHYDHDNPPPKVVQGYKFNVFYPDLIDRSKAPTYRIEREGGRKRGQSFAPAGEEDTCLIKFIAGPPYEDIAFRIVDKEWDYSAKRERGFKSSFDKGILQLHFQFKKIYYRK